MSDKLIQQLTKQSTQPEIGSKHLLDLASLALPQNYQEMVQVKKLLTNVPVGRPNNKQFIRVHQDPAYSLSTYIIDMKDDGAFIVTPQMKEHLAAECWPAIILTYITRDNNVGLWPVKLAGPDGKINRWHESALAGAQVAKKSWSRVLANMQQGAYEVLVALGELNEPIWPEENFQEILTIGFKNNIIASPDHVICQKLSGRI